MNQSSEKPQRGDIIVILHLRYMDWAVYVGGGNVVHLTSGKSSTIGLSNFFTYLWGDTEATKEPLKDAALGRVPWVYNHLDHEYRPRPVDEIIAAAEKMASDRKKYGAPIQNSERFVNELRYGQIPRKWSNEDPQPGDLIEISRSVFAHWAVYVGDGYVVHLLGSDLPLLGSCSSSPCSSPCEDRNGEVKRERLRDVVGGDTYRVNNYLDYKFPPRPVQAIIQLAEERVGPCYYNVLWANCEHFATDLRYGKRYSKQSNQVLRTGVLGVLGGLAASII
ncbi:phospholipase A and acyltransferase 4 isoform X1 [Oryctolagus cuniculus]|uniref:phospholipase A and acyltransferase 4 isoform X1 n=2 Tax=Oryctolagus cuniculus TaxID=9986 RepID=UPI003879FD7B